MTTRALVSPAIETLAAEASSIKDRQARPSAMMQTGGLCSRPNQPTRWR